MCKHLPLVIASAAAVKIVALDDRCERRITPLVERFGRLHVVVPVDQDRGTTRSFPVSVDERMLSGGNYLHIPEADMAQVIGEPGRAPLHIIRMGGLSADSRKANEFLQFLEPACSVLQQPTHHNDLDCPLHFQLVFSFVLVSPSACGSAVRTRARSVGCWRRARYLK